MIKMNIELTGIKEFEGSLDRIHDVIGDFTPELRDIGEWYENFLEQDVFGSEGAVYGETWQQLSPAYAKRKAKLYNEGRPILTASGTMRYAWKLLTTSQYALLENTTDYAYYHQEGKGVPQRMIVKFTQDVKDHVYDMFKEGILERIQNAVS